MLRKTDEVRERNTRKILFFFPNPPTRILTLLQQPKNSSPREKIAYICGLRARIECEPLSEHSTRSDRVTDIGYLLSWGASPFACGNSEFFHFTCFALGYILSILVSGNLVSNIFVMAFSGVFALWCRS